MTSAVQPEATSADGGRGEREESVPAAQPSQPSQPAALSIRHLACTYGATEVLHDINLEVPQGRCAALVGESGSGKSTIAKTVMGMKAPARGSVLVCDREVQYGRSRLRKANRRSGSQTGAAGGNGSNGSNGSGSNGSDHWDSRPRVHMVFQDPVSSLNPHRRILDVVAEPYTIANHLASSERLAKAAALLARVGIDPDRYGPAKAGELSGGQAQRVAIARAIAADPELLICDEPVSSLDVSVQATVLNLFADLRDQEHMSMLFISHNLSVVRMISDAVYVLDQGSIVESGDTEQVIRHPQHAYTQRLIASVPRYRAQA
ncbi:MAG: ATP-binding cassette domain-containing protein [Bifidobacterium tibiigranuli]|jgi:ABC-type glutathione transport system ATPase component|uniref:ABC transporter ATP-binding protein n=1 Tax=Bifidobacterium tibiigranuli TaxID=2172043 RepID=UPI002355AE49|nr:ATP-binding cassette domain-containing protein [Bifidobacterium tibiigranuli]MCH3975466.1 ATP-binding cassette domain-containing protein [Bifidobacterium tibiigranuli]MCH4190561.1 ATP-binding cassette domain-containing protein [Bifidobacterium tibiigranuli]MCH4204175.1 ATP-binding cassette domain-containing protein [Bifidobacterium tibiigranuli]MCH4274628.1 ATP-binding cassette domain-containing protein [Bifidobacterium tibiigranuli]MCI1791327.1 ATP-binding cassette domain-containing protei